MFAKIKYGDVVAYPYTFDDFRADNNNTNYGGATDILALFPTTDLPAQGFDCVAVADAPAPSFDALTQEVREGTPALVEGAWTQTWQVVDLDEARVAENRAALRHKIGAECQRRIYAVASLNCQTNMNAYRAGMGRNTPAADKAAFKDWTDWVQAMRAVHSTLVENADATFADDSHWPECPADVLALAARF